MSSKPITRALDIYGAELHIATNAKAWRKLKKLVNSLDDTPDSLGFTSFDLYDHDDPRPNQPHITIFINVEAHRGDELSLIDTCAHEATHAASMLFDHIGQAYDGRAEAHCYLVGAIASWCWAAVRQAG